LTVPYSVKSGQVIRKSRKTTESAMFFFYLKYEYIKKMLEAKKTQS
jgi:hypothetical protein